MVNEFIFLFSIVFIAASTVYALYLCPAALMALVSLQVVLMNLFVTKQITLFGFNATSTDALGIGAVLGINLLREYCGASTARTSVIVSFLAVTFYTVIASMQLAYVPSLFDTQQPHFVALLQPMPRILFASLFSYITIQILEYWLYDKLQRQFKGKYFILRNYSVVLFTQFLDTVLFTVLGLAGIVDHIGEIIIVSYAIKAVTIICMTPLLVFCKKVMQWSGNASF
jgi:uncharacterized integral membrane protein (TIGR00697 family)